MKAFAAAVFLALSSPAAAVPVSPWQEADPFTGAWSPDALEQAAEPILEAWRKGGPRAGDAALDAFLARADGASERARILTAYGVYLMVENTSEDETVGSTLALPYMQRALTEGRSGFPSDSRMLAVLLHDAATTEFMARGPDTSATAEAWLEEAHGIRRSRLGASHPETLSSLVRLAEIRGQPQRLESDPARIEAVSRLYEPLLTAEPGEEGDLDYAFAAWMGFLVDARRPDEACAVLQKVNQQAGRLRLNMDYIGFGLGEKLMEAGYEDRGKPLVREMGVLSLLTGGDPSGKPPRCGP